MTQTIWLLNCIWKVELLCKGQTDERCFHTPTLRHISQWRKPDPRLLSRKLRVWHKWCRIQHGVLCMCPASQFLYLCAVELELQPQTLQTPAPPWDTELTLKICSLNKTFVWDLSAWLFYWCSKTKQNKKRVRMQQLWKLIEQIVQ